MKRRGQGKWGRAQGRGETGERREETGVTGRGQDVGTGCGRGLGELGRFGERRVGHREERPSEERGEEIGWGLGRGMWKA